MAEGHKPRDYSTVSPYLIVDGADRTIAFLATVFGAVELRRIPRPDGRLMHAEVRIYDTTHRFRMGSGDLLYSDTRMTTLRDGDPVRAK